jgi:soluble lytic murein transglycosylase
MDHSKMESSPGASDAPHALQFIDTMNAHHDGAIDMAQLVKTRTNRDEMKKLAQNIIDAQRDNREDSDALRTAAETREKFKGKLPEALAMFAEARIRIARSEWPEALTALEGLGSFTNLGGATVAGGTTVQEVTFLRGLVLEELRRYSEAIDLYLTIPEGRNEYYGGRATDRLRLLASSEHGRPLTEAKLASLVAAGPDADADLRRRNLQSAIRLTSTVEGRARLLQDLQKVYAELPAYKDPFTLKLTKLGRQAPVRAKQATFGKSVANELLFLGLYDEAAPELESDLKAEQKIGTTKTDLDYTLAEIYRRGDMANRSSTFIESLWKVPADYQIELIPDAVMRMLYPTPYVDSMLRSASPLGVDARFLLSIMRQESRYRSDAKSYAAARGLMQFISSTASRIAGELGRDNFRQDDLYDPPTAVLFGSRYVSNLQKLFPNHLPAVAASYNGGEDNMQRWMLRSKSDLADRYVPEIGFAQSKDYVYRVMANYRIYRMLYDENLKRLGN